MNIYSNILKLEIDVKNEFYSDAIKLNTGRNCLEYILIAKKYKKIFLPFFICETILEPLTKLNIEIEYYSINEKFQPVSIKKIKEDECFLFVNYFGLNDPGVKYLVHKIKNLIIDNTQAFYSLPIKNIDTFYSARKFFGVPDGGYLFTDTKLNISFEKDISYKRVVHLIKSSDGGFDLLKNFHSAETDLSNQPIKYMSDFTKSMLASIDYEKSKKLREVNFSIYSKLLKDKNKINIIPVESVPALYYPFISSNENLRERLRKLGINTPIYWTSVLKNVKKTSFEWNLVKNLVLLPLDQQKTIKTVEKICDIILNLT